MPAVAAADVATLQAILGDKNAAKLRAAAQQETLIEAGALAVPLAQLTIGERIGAGPDMSLRALKQTSASTYTHAWTLAFSHFYSPDRAVDAEMRPTYTYFHIHASVHFCSHFSTA